MSEPPFRKVTDTLSQDTIECLEQLLHLAKDEGRLVGIVFAAQLEGRRIIANSAGECYRNPRWARAMAKDIDDYLTTRLHAQDVA